MHAQVRERREKKRRKRCGPGRLLRFADRARDPFVFGRKRFFVLPLNRGAEAGDSVFQLLAIIRRSVLGRTAVAGFREILSRIKGVYLTGHLYCLSRFGFMKDWISYFLARA